MNILNYVDRQIVYAAAAPDLGDLHLSDAQAGSLASAFMVVYMLAAPPIAWLADSRGRKPWIAGGVAIWSLATGAWPGLAAVFPPLFPSRAAVGIGEACYGAISPSFVAERFSPERAALRSRSSAWPSPWVRPRLRGEESSGLLGWRHAFWIVGPAGPLARGVCLLPAQR